MKQYWAQTKDFLVEAVQELKKTTWPNRKETLGTTGVVLILVFILGGVSGVGGFPPVPFRPVFHSLRQKGQTVSKKWYIIHTYSGFEQKVKNAIMERARSRGLEHLVEQVLVPTETVEEMVKGERNSPPGNFTRGMSWCTWR